MALSEGPSNGMREGLPCSLCECLKFQDYQPMSAKCDFHSRLFHKPCEDCAQNVDSSDCCTFCQHLRIRHLLICLSEWGSSRKDYENLKHFRVELGSIVELQSRQPCPLCQFFCDVMTIRYRFWQKTIPGEGKPIFLEFTCVGPALRVLDGVQEEIFFLLRDLRNHYSTPATLSSKIDWSALCEYTVKKLQPHSSSEHMSAQQFPQNFLVIDVDSGCIMSKPRTCTYAALSYVWGDSKQGDLQATLANIHDLGKPGALKQAGVPLTIRDAITAASELKIPYLWVDRFCIVQDDPQTKHDLINKMDVIYASAMVTFVAGAGKDPSYGLPGVSNERSPGQAHIRIHGMELTEELPSFGTDIIPRMAWSQRGWTYQEAIFSTNLIFFTDYGVFYRSAEAFQKVLATPSDTYANTVHNKMSDFSRSVEAYSKRTLSFETDIERAFSGVLHSYFDEEHAYGLPLGYFDAALHWKPMDRSWKLRQSVNDDIFPSWSWLSVMGRVDFSGVRSSDSNHPLPVATWAMNLRTASGKSELRFINPESDDCFIGRDYYSLDPELVDLGRILAGDDHSISPKRHKDFTYRSSLLDKAWDAGFFEGKRPSYSRRDTVSDDKCRWSFWLQSRGLQSISAPSQLSLPERYPLYLQPGHVLVRTQYVGFQGSLNSDNDGEGVSDDDEMQRLFEGLGDTRDVGMIALSFTELIVLVRPAPTYDNVNLDGEDGDFGYHEENCNVNVMMIRRVDSVAYRVGLGSVSLEAWQKARPSLETIVLG